MTNNLIGLDYEESSGFIQSLKNGIDPSGNTHSSGVAKIPCPRFTDNPNPYVPNLVVRELLDAITDHAHEYFNDKRICVPYCPEVAVELHRLGIGTDISMAELNSNDGGEWDDFKRNISRLFSEVVLSGWDECPETRKVADLMRYDYEILSNSSDSSEENGEFDMVIGMPRIGPGKFDVEWPKFYRTCLDMLEPETGIMCLIAPNKWINGIEGNEILFREEIRENSLADYHLGYFVLQKEI